MKAKDHLSMCRTYDDYIKYACRHGGRKGRVTGSHQMIIGPRGAMPIKCNHLHDQPTPGIAHVYWAQMEAIGIEIVP